MSRVFSGASGKHGSKKPVSKEAPAWVALKPKEIEALVVKLYNEGSSKSKIGTILRDQCGVPSVRAVCKKTIERILEENKLEERFPEDLMELIKRSVALQRHIKGNKKDQKSALGYNLCVAKIRRLTDYYAKKNKIPKDWTYSPETASLLVK